MIGSTKGRRKNAIGFRQAEKSKGTVASGDVFEAETTGWYLKTQSEEADASGHAKGSHN